MDRKVFAISILFFFLLIWNLNRWPAYLGDKKRVLEKNITESLLYSTSGT